MDDLERALRQVAGWSSTALTITPLSGGITNRNYRIEAGGKIYVARVPGERTEVLGIDRAHEQEAAVRAAALGIGPPVLGPLPGHTTLITEFVGGSHATDDADFVRAPRLEQIVAALRTFHTSGPIAGSFPIHRVVEWHARDAATNGVEPPPIYHWLHERSVAIEDAFNAAPVAYVPCHNDLLPANVLFDDDRVWILDFEYAGMNDVFFDLGNLSINSAFGPDDDERLLRSYFGEVSPARLARVQLMKIMSEFREGMWAVVQQAISTLDTDFVAYADARLGNCRRLIETAPFEAWLVEASGSVTG
jgi:thiamine kinase-like enzyme